MFNLLGISRLRRRRAPAEETTIQIDAAAQQQAPGPGVVSGNGIPPTPPVPQLPDFARKMAAAPPAPPQHPVIPPPAINVTEDEDEVIERLFPQNVPGRIVSAVPMPPTVQMEDRESGVEGREAVDVQGPSTSTSSIAPAQRPSPSDPTPRQPSDQLATDLGVPGVPVVATPIVGEAMPAPSVAAKGWTDLDEPITSTAHLHEHEFSEAELAVDAEQDAREAERVRPAHAPGKRNLFSALLIIGHLLVLSALHIPVTAYIVRRLGPLGYGQWAAATELVTFAGLMTTLGLRPLFVRAVAQRPELAEEELSYQLVLRSLLTLGASGLAMGVAVALGYPPVVITCVAIAVGAMTLTVIGQTLADLLQGLHRMKAYSAINFVQGLSLTVASVLVVMKDPNPVAVSVAYVSGPLVGLLFYLVVVGRHVPIRLRFSLAKFRELLRESRTIAAYQISVVVRDRMERVMLPKLSGMSSFGFYNAGIMPADRLFVIPEGFITAFFPAISRSHYEDEKSGGGDKSASRHVLHLMVTSLVACAPIAILVTFLADPFSKILFPRDPDLCRQVIMISIWALPLKGLQLPMGCALQASGRHATAAKTGIVATFFSLGLTVVLILTMGIVGACWAWVGRAAISALFLVPAFIKTFPSVYPRVPAFRILLGVAIMGGLLWYSTLLPPQIHMDAWIVLTAGACVAVMVYFLAMVLMRVIEISDLKMMLRRRTAE